MAARPKKNQNQSLLFDMEVKEERWMEPGFHRQGFRSIIGVDEAGRGPLAGPVVASAVILRPDAVLPELDDSKRLTAAKRDALFDQVRKQALAVGVGVACAADIDRLNILQATFHSMRLAITQVRRLLSKPADLILLDGKLKFDYDIPIQAIVKGDHRCKSIAAASIIAKVTRDRIMEAYDDLYPQYGLAGHKGYPTEKHREAIREFGPTPLHRLSFRGVLPEEEEAPSEEASQETLQLDLTSKS